MNRHNKGTLIFYLVALTLAILSGFKFGFNAGSHTAPLPFVIEIFIIGVGLVWLLIETIIMSMKRIQTWKDILGGLKIWDGGTSSILIKHCPWCGQTLPDSKRDKWFEEVEKLGIDPWTEDVPDKYNTDVWFRGRANS
jgi:hypothetical protein